MNHRWAVPTRRRGARVPAALVVGALLMGALSATGASAASSPAIRNLDFSAGTSGWSASSGSRFTTVKTSGPDIGQLRRTAKRSGSMSVRTASSSETMTRGSRVDVSAQIRGTRKGGRTTVRVYETRRNGSVVQWRSAGLRKTSTRFATRKVTLTARETGTRFHVRFYLSGAKRGQALRIKRAAASVRPAPAPTPTPTPSPGPEPSPPPTPEESYLANSRCESGAAGWATSANALVRPASEPTTPATSCEVALKAGLDGSVTATSDPSTRTVADVGSRVHIASQVKATEADKTLRMTLQEVDPSGAVVQSFAGQRPSATGFAWVGAELRTRAPGSRVRVVYSGESLPEGAAMRFTQATVTVTPPEVVTPPPATEPPPTEPPAPPPPAPEPQPTPCSETDYSDPRQGTLSFNDEFNGSSIDTSKWRVRDGESLSFDAARILTRNVSVDDGLLTIRGKRETVAGRDWTTGYLDTIGKHAQKYGRWEMRAKIPTDDTMTRGVWPAFWLRSSSPGEIDIMEAYGSPSHQDRYSPSKRYEWTVWKYSTVPAGQTNERVMGHHVPATPPGKGFHTYAVDWSPECLRFSFDGKTTGVVPMDAKPWLATSFKDPFHIRLNMQVGSSYWGMPTATETKPAFDYVIDHVRVYAPR